MMRYRVPLRMLLALAVSLCGCAPAVQEDVGLSSLTFSTDNGTLIGITSVEPSGTWIWQYDVKSGLLGPISSCTTSVVLDGSSSEHTVSWTPVFAGWEAGGTEAFLETWKPGKGRTPASHPSGSPLPGEYIPVYALGTDYLFMWRFSQQPLVRSLVMVDAVGLDVLGTLDWDNRTHSVHVVPCEIHGTRYIYALQGRRATVPNLLQLCEVPSLSIVRSIPVNYTGMRPGYGDLAVILEGSCADRFHYAVFDASLQEDGSVGVDLLREGSFKIPVPLDCEWCYWFLMHDGRLVGTSEDPPSVYILTEEDDDGVAPVRIDRPTAPRMACINRQGTLLAWYEPPDSVFVMDLRGREPHITAEFQLPGPPASADE